ncbi:MAG: hypothetical protein KDA79_16320 [Planctomycetaceae bacterium]|nr:hypothetical protein [Planctomycetaceae bacterium]
MALSWSTYRRRVARFPVARLMAMTAICGFVAYLPWLESPRLWPAPVGVLAGLVLPLAVRRLISRDPGFTQWWLGGHGVLLGLMGWFRGTIPDPLLVGLVGLAGASWCSIWFVLYAESDVFIEGLDQEPEQENLPSARE